MGKLGRKRSREAGRRTKTVGTRLTEEEYGKLIEACDKMGITPAEYLRHLIVAKRPPKVNTKKVLKLCEGYKEIAKEINAIGVNLNQITRYVHSRRELDIRVLEKMVKIEEELRALLYSVYEALEELVNADTPSGKPEQFEE